MDRSSNAGFGTSPAAGPAPHAPNGVAGPPGLRWTPGFAGLGDAFFTRLAAEPLPAPAWVATSDDCAALLDLPADWYRPTGLAALDVLAGNAVWPGMDPLATVYSGHQFGVWAGQLGDGRALWLGETVSSHGRFEWQLKGAGRTPYSRMGDGRAVLRSSIREFLCSEAMAALGVPTTRALAVLGSPLPVRRETLETAAVVTRIAPSFVRFGHFEHFSHHAMPDELRRLIDFVIEHHAPDCRDAPNPALALLAQVVQRTAELIAAWQSVGFCHGVMNTDNMSILGLTIDYGPFGFLDAFEPDHICNHSDEAGRYAWNRQPNVGYWNLHALAHALLPAIGDGELALGVIGGYKAAFAEALGARWSAKLGLATRAEGDRGLADDLLGLMAADRADFTIVFRRLAVFSTAPGATNDAVGELFRDRAAFDAWAARYRRRLLDEASDDRERGLRMNRVNPKYLLRNHLAEEAIRSAQAGDFAPTQRLHEVLRRPFDEQDAATADRYAGFPPPWASQIEVSCSS